MSPYLKTLVKDIHSVTVATNGPDGYPQTRIIDMMLYDEKGVYFLTAKGKAFYSQLMEQQFLALSATKDKKAISLRGKIKNIGQDRLNEIFDQNPYMKEIYPEHTRHALEVFCLYEANGEYFDISNPSHIIREVIEIGAKSNSVNGYYVNDTCDGCQACIKVCPQSCISFLNQKAEIIQNRCLHCGNCVSACLKGAIQYESK